MIYWFLTIPLSSENFCKEKMYIMDMANKNGYDSKTIESIIRKKARTMERENLTTLFSEQTPKKAYKYNLLPCGT